MPRPRHRLTDRNHHWGVILLWIIGTAVIYLCAHRVSFSDVPESAIVVVAGQQPIPEIREGNKLLFSPLYLASLNPETKFCDWVQYRCTPALMDTGNVLNRNWRTTLRDAALEDADYADAPYDRGHLVPLACVSASPDAWHVNRMEVIAPQTPELNRGAWLKLEEHIRDLARTHGVVLVTVGTLYEAKLPPLPASDEPHRVPSHFWVRLTAGDGKRAAVECYVLPQKIKQDAPFEQYALDERTLRGRVKTLPR